MDIADARKNTNIYYNNVPYKVVEADLLKPGKGSAIFRLKMKSLIDGSVLDHNFHAGDKVDEARVNTYEMQYLYKENDQYVFMNTETFEQSFMTEAQVGDKKFFLKEGIIVLMMMLEEKPIDFTLPTFVELQVVKSDVSSRSDTVTAQMKSATLETGFVANVPTFIKEGDIIKVDTRTGVYLERITGKK